MASCPSAAVSSMTNTGVQPSSSALLAALGHETIALRRWAGVALSVAGIYLIVGRDAAMGGESLRGDLVMLGAVMCWSFAAVISKPVLGRQPPLVVTGYSMAIGTVIYTPFAWPALRRLAWSHVGVNAWLALVFSAAFALCVAYMIWYTAVQRLGNTRTSAYSNMVPMAAMFVGWAFFDEPIGLVKLAGAAAILLGVVLART